MADAGPDGLDEIWPNFHSEPIFDDISSAKAVAADVLATFNVPTGTLATQGGKLDNLDIKRMDALQAIKLSLLEASFEEEDANFYELSSSPEGEVEFISIGASTYTATDVYYELQSSSCKYDCSGVLVTGAKPFATMKPLVWKSIWGETKTSYDTTHLSSSCVSPDYSSHAVITFRDPHLDSGYDDGIDNLYELTDPFENIIGYAKLITAKKATKSTNIAYSDGEAVIPLSLFSLDGTPNMGTLQPIDDNIIPEGGDPNCWTGGIVAANATEGVRIPIPEEFRFTDIRNTEVDLYVGVEQVVIIGWKIDYFNPVLIPGTNPNEKLADDNSVCALNVSNTKLAVFRLEEGKHYVIAYDEDKAPYVLFAKRSFPADPKVYGANTNTLYLPLTEGAINTNMPQSPNCVFPTEGNSGILVKEIVTYVKFNSPSITVTDTGGIGNAKDIADDIKYSVAPLINYEPPAPMAFNGVLLDLTDGIIDKDPTSTQTFTNTELEKALDTLSTGGHGMEINLSFLDTEESVRKASSVLYKIMSAADGINTTYMCGPNAKPKLGQKGTSGGIINAINYSYSDQSSYTISVNEGDYLIDGLGGGCSLAPALKATESVTARGVVLDTLGDGVIFKVKINGIGDRTAINMAPTLIRVGDIVSCSVHNVPVEV